MMGNKPVEVGRMGNGEPQGVPDISSGLFRVFSERVSVVISPQHVGNKMKRTGGTTR